MYTPIAYRVFDTKILIEVVYASASMATKHIVLGAVPRETIGV